MAQHDYVIDNQSFPATRTDLNNVLQAIVSNNSGTSAPSATFANQIWYDSSANILYIRNEDNDANIPLLQFDQSADVAATLATVIDILDASGTNQAGTALTIRGGAGTGTGAGGSVIIQTADGGSSGSSVNSHATRVTITDDGKVGIGTSTPSHTLNVSGTGARIYLTDANEDIDMDGSANGQLKLDGNGYAGAIALNASGMRLYHNSSSLPLIFGTNETERARIDPSGRLLVGKTAADGGVAGFEARNTGETFATASGTTALYAHRLASDGHIVAFQQGGSTVGVIAADTGDLVIGTGNTGLRFFNNGASIIPRHTDGSAQDNALDLGSSASRFDDIFATNGTIQTSDQTEKQDIDNLTSAEITAAKAISKLFKTFKWKDKVEAKGDAARTHTGVIAQEVQSAMSDAGLDATKYAFWCSDTWWEKDVEVPAVEADEENGIEAKDAFTRTDVYETEDEAPDDATERTRLGIRYPELLAFIGAATEQRLTDIETRLTALEG